MAGPPNYNFGDENPLALFIGRKTRAALSRPQGRRFVRGAPAYAAPNRVSQARVAPALDVRRDLFSGQPQMPAFTSPSLSNGPPAPTIRSETNGSFLSSTSRPLRSLISVSPNPTLFPANPFFLLPRAMPRCSGLLTGLMAN